MQLIMFVIGSESDESEVLGSAMAARVATLERPGHVSRSGVRSSPAMLIDRPTRRAEPAMPSRSTLLERQFSRPVRPMRELPDARDGRELRTMREIPRDLTREHDPRDHEEDAERWDGLY
jgi:hypothetical protein